MMSRLGLLWHILAVSLLQISAATACSQIFTAKVTVQCTASGCGEGFALRPVIVDRDPTIACTITHDEYFDLSQSSLQKISLRLTNRQGVFTFLLWDKPFYLVGMGDFTQSLDLGAGEIQAFSQESSDFTALRTQAKSRLIDDKWLYRVGLFSSNYVIQLIALLMFYLAWHMVQKNSGRHAWVPISLGSGYVGLLAVDTMLGVLPRFYSGYAVWLIATLLLIWVGSTCFLLQIYMKRQRARRLCDCVSVRHVP